MCDEFFDQLRQPSPVKNLGEIKIYIGCAFERDWDNGTLEMNQTAFAGNMVASTNFHNLEQVGEPGCRCQAEKRWRVRGYPQYRALVRSLMWLSVMSVIGLTTRTHFAHVRVTAITLLYTTGRRFCR